MSVPRGITNIQSERDLIGGSHFFFYKGAVKTFFKSGCISILVLMNPAHPAMIYLVAAGLQRALEIALQRTAVPQSTLANDTSTFELLEWVLVLCNAFHKDILLHPSLDVFHKFSATF